MSAARDPQPGDPISYINTFPPPVMAHQSIFTTVNTSNSDPWVATPQGPPPAKLVAFEGGKLAIYCPRCGKGGVRDARAISLKAGREEHCTSCASKYILPSLEQLGLDPGQLRQLAAAASALADKIERGEL